MQPQWAVLHVMATAANFMTDCCSMSVVPVHILGVSRLIHPVYLLVTGAVTLILCAVIPLIVHMSPEGLCV